MHQASMISPEESEKDWPKELPMQVPESYFETFPERMLKKVKEQEQGRQSTKIIKIRVLITLAASLLVALAGVFTYRFLKQTAMPENHLATALQNTDDSVIVTVLNNEETIGIIEIRQLLEESDESEVVCEFLLDQELSLDEIISEHPIQ